jgi:hypothetical protein
MRGLVERRLLLLAALSRMGRAQFCPTADGSGCTANVVNCLCTDDDGTEWDLNALRGEQTTTGPNEDGGDWDYRLDLCGDVTPVAPGCAFDSQAIREDEDQTVCQLLGLPQQTTLPAITSTGNGISMCFEFGTGGNARSLTVNLVCDEAAGAAGELGEVDSSDADVAVEWATDTVCGGSGPAPEPDPDPPEPDPEPDPDPDPDPEPDPEPDPGVRCTHCLALLLLQMQLQLQLQKHCFEFACFL